jgi:hypothetical protein
MEHFFSFYDTTVNRDCELGEWSNWTEPSGVGIIERVRLVKVKELGNGKCPALRGKVVMRSRLKCAGILHNFTQIDGMRIFINYQTLQ